MKSTLELLSAAPFFVLSSDYRQSMLDELYYLVKYANFTRKDVLLMPVFERKYMLSKLHDEFEKKKEAQENARNKSK